MKYFVTLLAIAGAYAFLIHSSPIAPVAKVIAEPRVDINPGPDKATEPASNFVKRPLDRAHAVAELVRKEKTGESF